MYLRDVSSYFEQNELVGKLNQLLTKENLDNFFVIRLENLASSTKENYLRGFSSLLNGLESKNIEIPLHSEDENYFDDKVALIKNEAETIIENKYIDNVDAVINDLYEQRHVSGLIAEVQYKLCIRQEEAFELVRNPFKYIDNGTVKGLVGKGNHIYENKYLPFLLEQKILANTEDLISKSTYWNYLQKYNISSHHFRFTSARDKFEMIISNGIPEKEAKIQISKELNHKREEITNYYLKRT